VKALTLHQPWATAIAEGIKTIETRSWATDYRGPLAIHAGSKMAPGMAGPAGMFGRYIVDRDGPGEEWYILDSDWPGRDQGQHQYPIYLPLGAVVAVANLVDVVPIGGPTSFSTGIFEGEEPPTAGMDVIVHHAPRGDWAPESLVLDRWNGPTENIDSELPWGDFTPGRFAWLLDDVRKLHQPIPAKGRQGLWEWDESLAVEA
jgi:hypothetical protein